mmetsp:Transcript_66582/g.100331  ORF Transcript_66582/g.100331 Transcript_66582/m.100331 type:complete len:99 (+) Transcript_66582:1930-2226(+)
MDESLGDGSLPFRLKMDLRLDVVFTARTSLSAPRRRLGDDLRRGFSDTAVSDRDASYEDREKPPTLRLDAVEAPEKFLLWKRSPSSKMFDDEWESGGN